MSAIVTDGLTKVFNGLVAVDHVSFEVREGEVFGFLGPNGAGKTTTINMLTTVLRPTEGRAEVMGYDIVSEAGRVRESIGVVPQEYTADEDLTGYENVLLCADLYAIPREVSRKRAIELLELVDLLPFKDKKVETYSGGMRRRLELACGLVNQPKLLFLDEPTLGLDVQTRFSIWEYIKRLKSESDMTIFLTTHYLEEADALCDRVAIIDHGKILTLGSPEELKKGLGGDVVTVRVDSTEDLTPVLSELEGIVEVRKVNDSYLVRARDGETAAPRIMEVLRARGQRVLGLSLTRPTLDEVYLNYTGRRMRDTEVSAEEVRKQRFVLRRARA